MAWICHSVQEFRSMRAISEFDNVRVWLYAYSLVIEC